MRLAISDDVTLIASKIGWREAHSMLLYVQDLQWEREGVVSWHAKALHFSPKERDGERDATYDHVTLKLSGGQHTLHAGRVLITSSSLRLEDVSWSQDDVQSFARARRASIDTNEDGGAQDNWKVEGLDYTHIYRRAAFEVGTWQDRRGLLMPRLSVVSKGLGLLVGEEATLLPLGARGQLFAGVWAAPRQSDGGLYGVSAGMASTQSPHGAWSGAPLRLDLGFTTRASPSSENLRVSLQGDALFELRGEAQHIDLHLEEGSPELVRQNIRASGNGLRSWQQSRVGAMLGAPETLMVAGVVHDVESEDWIGRMLVGGSQLLGALGLRVEYLVDHTSLVDDRRTHVHESILSPGVSMHRGSTAHAYFKAYGGPSFGQTSYQDASFEGIDASQSISAQAILEVGASFEGRWTPRLRHRLSPRLEGFVVPVAWARPRKGTTASGRDTKWSALSGMIALDQSFVVLGNEPSHEAFSLELPVSNVSLVQWSGANEREYDDATNFLLLSPALRIQPTGLEGVSLGLTSWVCQTTDPMCGNGALRQVGAEIGRPGRWSVGYFKGSMSDQLLALKWLSSANMHAGALQANQWLAALRGARQTPSSTRPMHAFTANLTGGLIDLELFLYMLPQHWKQDIATGIMARASYTPPSTGWSWDMVASIDERLGSQWMGLMWTWSGR